MNVEGVGEVSIERTFYCDWRECEGHTRTVKDEPGMGFLTVVEEDCLDRHFCSSDCLLKHIAETPPVEIVGGPDV